jgi:hypothetical protein
MNVRIAGVGELPILGYPRMMMITSITQEVLIVSSLGYKFIKR